MEQDPHLPQVILQELPFEITILAGRVGPSSMQMYTRDFRAYLEYAQTPDNALQASTLARWITHLVTTTMMSPNTINRMVSAVKKIMKIAASQGYISHETAEAFKHVDGVSVKTLKDRLRIRNRVRITPENMRTLIETLDTTTLVGMRNKALFLTLASSGLRIRELSRLKKEQIINAKDGLFLLHMYAEEGKNQEEDRDANISREAVTAIYQWLAVRPVQSDFIFTSFDGRSKSPDARALNTPITPQGAWKVVKEIAEPLIPGVKPHDFRRFVGTQVIKNKGIVHAQKALGHKSITTTTKYDLSGIEAGVTDDLF
jgi:integrase/recombinase XerD